MQFWTAQASALCPDQMTADSTLSARTMFLQVHCKRRSSNCTAMKKFFSRNSLLTLHPIAWCQESNEVHNASACDRHSGDNAILQCLRGRECGADSCTGREW